MNEVTFVVRDFAGEYLGLNGRRTPAAEEAQEFETYSQAEEACSRSTDRILVRDENAERAIEAE